MLLYNLLDVSGPVCPPPVENVLDRRVLTLCLPQPAVHAIRPAEQLAVRALLDRFAVLEDNNEV